ncbi:circularly permuted type 2 ATP-grasp protein [Streptomyces galilaeus]|uniref:circularly permuted type 2 ATP-grasp protein n=1 Tax=Streptomyces galilaeus TaxID=33899 RepID=UPI001677EE34|nr:circularly permuted type 2 ATP-grasp protein [Streptomyces galilaeus]GGW85930.1 hypothetical protein GCM10010350_83030 [Streptomyces galilaeus]
MDRPWFDEAFDQYGALRPQYDALRRRAGWDPLLPTTALAQLLHEMPLGDDTRIFPIPVVIDDAEYRAVVQAGLVQRARALQQLFTDLALGPQKILTAGIGLDRAVLDEILAVEGTSLEGLRKLWRGRTREEVRFVYGPDLVRDPEGRWTVLEDNVGCVAGSADSFFVADRYRSATQLPGCSICQGPPDLAIAITRWLHRLGSDLGDRVAAVLGCDAAGESPWALRLHENARRRMILDTLGIPVIERGQLLGRQVAWGGRSGVLVNFSVDQSWSDVFCIPGIKMLNAPGTGVLGNKAFLPYIDDAIRFYACEEPILPTPPTHLLTEGVLPDDKENWVIKSAVGCQGTEVFVLRWQPQDRLRLLEDRVSKEWCGAAAVAQRYVEPSHLAPARPNSWNDYRVEIRPVTYVLDWRDIYVSEQAVGKTVSTYDARRLNNISQGACYVPVLREPCSHCGTER